MCANDPSSRPRRGRQKASTILYGLTNSLGWWLSVILVHILLTSGEVGSQYSSHCHFNQLCSCRVVPVKKNSQYAGGRGVQPPGEGVSSESTPITSSGTPSYTGQFGVITEE